MRMKFSVLLIIGLWVSPLYAQEKIKFYYNNEEIGKVLEGYSRASGKKMIVDPGIKGKISIFNPDSVSLEEAFNQVSQALAINGFAIIHEGESLVVRPVRQVQRSLIEVGSELPPPKPERLFSWVVTLKNIPVSVVSKDIKILVSKEGETSVLKDNNQMIFVDWISNLYRIRELLRQIDVPKNQEAEKMIQEYLKVEKKKNH